MCLLLFGAYKMMRRKSINDEYVFILLPKLTDFSSVGSWAGAHSLHIEFTQKVMVLRIHMQLVCKYSNIDMFLLPFFPI